MERAELARQWAGALTQVIYVARSRDEVERELLGYIGQLVGAVTGEDATADRAGEVGGQMVAFGFTKPICLQHSVELLGTAMPTLPELHCVPDAPDRVMTALGAMAAGFTSGMRSRLFAEQEDIKRALTHAKENVERDLQASEALFREIFTASSVGMALSDLNGTLLRTNRALAEILEYPARELGGKSLHELFHPDEAEYLTMRYQELLDEDTLPFRERRKLLRKDGDEALVYLSGSVMGIRTGRRGIM